MDMMPSRFLEELVIGILREQEVGAQTDTGPAARHSTNGTPNAAGRKCPTPSG
jgi:hypothetical protein